MDDFSHLTTPAFLVDRSVVARNCDRMREKAAASGVMFRPHVKTHKTAEIARMQHGGGEGPVTVSTVAEAELLAGSGFKDVTYAVPIAPDKLPRLAALALRLERLNILLDSLEALQAVEAFSRSNGLTFDLFLKVDCGYHRAGIDPDRKESVELAQRISRSEAVRFRGLLTHAGHSYHARTPDEIRTVARQEVAAVTRFRDRVGLDLVRSVGSTPTASVVERFEDCDEVRPGNYVFYDAFQATIGSCRLDDCAVSVLTTVIGAYAERGTMIVDAGALALSKDLGPDHIEPHFGYGIVCDTTLRPLPMRLHTLSQEHGKVAAETVLPVGAKLRIIPNHSCLTAAMYAEYHVVEEGRLLDRWRPARGW
ncbi:MAG TPA: alanine racemase [Thermoanaerobaculia bacterium]|nr:alanine racemase [Thermoanaerobaculia bacterium]